MEKGLLILPRFVYDKFEGDVSSQEETKKCDDECIRLVIFGDSKGKEDGINENILRKMLKKITELNPQPQYIVILGDSVDGSKEENILKSRLDRFINLVRSYHPIKTIIPVLGNHEVNHRPKDDTAEKIFADNLSLLKKDGQLEEYNSTVYYLDIANTRFIILNSHHCGETKRIGEKQLKWFKEVAAEPMQHKIVFLHAPAYPTGAHLGTCLDKYPEERNKLWKIIDANNIDIVFAGHEHNYSRRIIDKSFSNDIYQFNNKIYQVISGGGGEKLKHSFESKEGVIVSPKAVHHFIVLDIQGENISVEAVSLEGEKIDGFTISK